MHEGDTIYRFLKYCLSMKAQNKMDVFTLEKIEPPFFYYVQEENIIYKYNAPLLADFIEDTGCKKDPQTQQPYNTVELQRLQRITGRTFVDKKTEVVNELDNVIPFLESEVGNSIHAILEQTTEEDPWLLLLQTLQELKSISMDHYTTIMNNSIRNVEHEYKRMEKQQRLLCAMIRHSDEYDFFIDETGNISICLEDKIIFKTLRTCLKRSISHKKLLVDLKRTLYYHTRFREIMLRLNELPSIPENVPLI